MFAIIILTAGIALLGGVAGVIFAPNRLAMKIGGFLILAIGSLALVVIFWKYVMISLLISMLIYLGVCVVLQKYEPKQALLAAIVAIVIMVILNWVVLQLADPLLFHQSSELSRWFHGL